MHIPIVCTNRNECHAVHCSRQRIRPKSHIYHWSNIVCKVIMPRTGQPGNRISTSDRTKSIQTLSGAPAGTRPVGTGVKRPRLKPGHLRPYSAEVENAWNLPQHVHRVQKYNSASLK